MKNLSGMMRHREYKSHLVTHRMLAQDMTKSRPGYVILAHPAGIRRVNCRVMFTRNSQDIYRICHKGSQGHWRECREFLPSASFAFEYWQWDFIFLPLRRALEARALHGI